MRRVIATGFGGGLYSQRQWMVEPVFAQIKPNRRIDRFKRRGLAAARSEWRLVATTHPTGHDPIAIPWLLVADPVADELIAGVTALAQQQ